MTKTLPQASGGNRYRWTILIASTIIITATYGIVYSFGVFLPHYEEYFNSSSAAISGAYSLSILLYMVMGIFAGWVIDHFGPKVTTIPGGLLLVLGFFLTSRVTSVWQMYVTYAVIGIGMSPMYNPLMTTVSRWFTSQKRGMALGILSTGLGIGPLITAPFTTYLISIVGWRSALAILGLVAGGIIIACALVLKNAPSRVISLVHNGMSKTGTKDGLTLKQAAHTRSFWLISAIYLMIGFALQMVMVHVVSYSLSRGMTAFRAAAVLSTISGASTIGRMVIGSASDRIGRKKALTICLFLEGVMIWWLAVSREPWMLFAFGLVFGFFYGGHVPTLPALVGDTMGLAYMGTVLGVSSAFWGIGGAIGPLFAGRIVDTTGSYFLAFIIGGLCPLTGAIISLFIRRPQTVS